MTKSPYTDWSKMPFKASTHSPVGPKLSYIELRRMMDDTLNDMRRPIGKEYLKALEDLHIALCNVAKFN